MLAVQPARYSSARTLRPGAVPARRVVRVRGRGLHKAAPLVLAGPAHRPARRGFLTRVGREKLVSRFWIGFLLSLWAVLLVFAGRDGLKPQDPSAAANIIRK